MHCSISSALAMEIQQSCTKASKWLHQNGYFEFNCERPLWTHFINTDMASCFFKGTSECCFHSIFSRSPQGKYRMMTSSNGNIFRVTGPLCGEFTGHRWIPLTKASDAELWCFLWSAPWINGWVNNREAGDLRCHQVHYDFIVMDDHDRLNDTYTFTFM